MAAGLRLPEINIIVLAGRATRDAELFTTSTGTQKATIRMAVSRRYKDVKSGEWKDQVFYIDVVAWAQMADRAKERAKKGVALIVEGRLTAREFDDKSGQKRTIFEVMANRIQFLSQPGESAAGPATGKPGEAAASEGEAAAGNANIEEVPF